MSNPRIKELQQLADDFYNRLQASEQSIPNEEDKIIYPYNKKIKKSYSTIVPKSENNTINYKKSLSNNNLLRGKNRLKPLAKKTVTKMNIYDSLSPWIPPNYIGNYFESFKRLTDHYDMNNWEKVILNLLILI